MVQGRSFSIDRIHPVSEPRIENTAIVVSGRSESTLVVAEAGDEPSTGRGLPDTTMPHIINSNSTSGSVGGNGVRSLPSPIAEVAPDLTKTYPHSKRVGSYLLGKTVGEGSFAKVKEGLHVLTGEKVYRENSFVCN